MTAAIKPRLLGLSGSLRKASYNKAILVALADLVADKASLDLFPPNDVPVYDRCRAKIRPSASQKHSTICKWRCRYGEC